MGKQDWQRKMGDAFKGRQGPDDLAVTSTNLAVVVLVVDLFAHVRWLGWLALALLAYAIWRMMSRNIPARTRENSAFLKALGPNKVWVQNPKAGFAELRQYKHVKCPGCGQRVRVPRGKGKLRVTCPKCAEKFEVRS